jgi:hypothetical protein
VSAPNVAVNLASRPLRNRRFFALLLAALGAAFVVVALIAGLTFLKARRLEAASRDDLVRVERESAGARKEKDARSAEAAVLSKQLKETVDATNGILVRKSFSLVDVFNRLEEALPPGSYIAGMAPLEPADGRIDLRFRVVSSGLADLLALVQKLGEQGFKNISVKNEATIDGRLVSEIGFSHERAL